MSNYPPGAANDKRAPYNQTRDGNKEWKSTGEEHECVCCREFVEVDSNVTCEECFVPYEEEE